MKTLHLNLKRKWFEMIFNGEKPEEYREIKEHWVSQFFNRTEKPIEHFTHSSARSTFNFLTGYTGGRYPAIIYGIDKDLLYVKNIITITFSNGYATHRPQFEIEFKGLEIRGGNPEWGAEPNKKYFVLKLGEILNDVNCSKFAVKELTKDTK